MATQPRTPGTTDRRKRLPKMPIQMESESSYRNISSNTSNMLQELTSQRTMNLLTDDILLPPISSSGDLSPHYGKSLQGLQGVLTEQKDETLNLAQDLENCEMDSTRQQINEPPHWSFHSSPPLSFGDTSLLASHSHGQWKQQEENEASSMKDTKVYHDSLENINGENSKNTILGTQRKISEGIIPKDVSENFTPLENV
ncbi:hypothetical protein G7Y89_g13639 [Cudoniella acicularis]|uniref:Uncharacterized protein n=1 Tax=Cudoniella acicularis TaxID=354080 RepID=A0A8H4R9F5_9HELO|nr:hypothetical protein G7Y89_g13639 [Cudoniella acicularis]